MATWEEEETDGEIMVDGLKFFIALVGIIGATIAIVFAWILVLTSDWTGLLAMALGALPFASGLLYRLIDCEADRATEGEPRS